MTESVAGPRSETLDAQANLKKTLSDMRAFLHKEFAGRMAEPRLHQFDSAVTTADMAIDHLYDEAERARYVTHPNDPKRVIPSGDDPYRRDPEGVS